MTRLEELTTIFKAFRQNTLISADITVQLNEVAPCLNIEIDLEDDDDKAHVGALLQSLLGGEINKVKDTLTASQNTMGNHIQPGVETMYYNVRVQQDSEDTYHRYNVKANSVNDALQIAFCLDGGANDGSGGPNNLLALAKMYAEVVK